MFILHILNVPSFTHLKRFIMLTLSNLVSWQVWEFVNNISKWIMRRNSIIKNKQKKEKLSPSLLLTRKWWLLCIYTFVFFFIQMKLFPTRAGYENVFRPSQSVNGRKVYISASAAAGPGITTLFLLLPCLYIASLNHYLWKLFWPSTENELLLLHKYLFLYII